MLGTTLAFGLHYSVKTYFKNFPALIRHDSTSSKVTDSTYNVTFKIIIAAILTTFVVPMAIAFLVWIYSKNTQVIDPNWDQRLKAFCGDDPY